MGMRNLWIRSWWRYLWDRRKGELETIGAVIAISALIYTAQQARSAKTALVQSSWNEINAFQIEVDKAFLEHPELRPYFEEDKPIGHEDELYNRVMALADLHLDFFDVFDDDYVRALPGMADNGDYWPLWENYFVRAFVLSPSLRQRYVEVKDLYSPKGPAAVAFEKARQRTRLIDSPSSGTLRTRTRE